MASASMFASVAFGAGNTYTGHLIGRADTASVALGLTPTTTNSTGSFVFNGPNLQNVNNDTTDMGIVIFGSNNTLGDGSDHSTMFDFGNTIGQNCNDSFVAGENNTINSSGGGVGWSTVFGLNNTITNLVINDAYDFVSGSGNLVYESRYVFVYGQNNRNTNASGSVILGAFNTNSGPNSILIGRTNNNAIPNTIFLGFNNQGLNISSNGTLSGNGSGLTNVPSTGLSLSITNTGNTNLATAWFKIKDANGNIGWILGITNQP